MTPTIEAHGVVKRFGATMALDGLDLTTRPGQVTALLGPNGAGKTTFVRILATLTAPDAGSVRITGHDVARRSARVRRTIGLAGQSAAVEPAMTGRENLEMVARLYGQPRRTARASAQRLLARLRLSDAADRPVRTYSGGMRRRLDLGASLVAEPRLLLLDEPTTGLDPRSRIELWDAVRGLVADGTDVLLTTQYLDEADQLAEHIVIIDHGRVVAAGSAGELKRQIGGHRLDARVRHARQLPRAAQVLAAVAGAEPTVDHTTRRVSVPVDGGARRLLETLAQLEGDGVGLDDLALRSPTLDEVFLELTGHPTHPAATSERPTTESQP
jgi:ABC-2 type transport system ATP-binding protein